MTKERPSLQLLRSVFEEAQMIIQTRKNHGNEHPYAIVEGETVEEDGIKRGFLLATSLPEVMTTHMMENLFSIYGDIESVLLDRRFNSNSGPYFIIEFSDDDAVEEVLRCKERLIFGQKPAKVYRMRKEPADRQ